MTETSVTWKSADGTVTENDAAAAPVKVERRVPELDFVTNRETGCGDASGRKTPFTPVLWATRPTGTAIRALQRTAMP